MFLCSLPTVLNVFRGLKNKLSTLLSQTDKNQTKEEPATVVIEELLLPPYSYLPPACWEYGKPLEKMQGHKSCKGQLFLLHVF